MATCTQHQVETNLSCRSCGTAVCADCAVRTPLGISCAAHASDVAGSPFTAAPPPGPEGGGPGPKRLVLGGVVLALVIAGIVFLRPSPGGDDGDGPASWRMLAPAGLSHRTGMSFVSTEETVIVWGGSATGGPQDNGAVLDLRSGSWTALPQSPLAGRTNHSAVWTGSKMIVFGGQARGEGCRPNCSMNDGASYDPAANLWAPIAAAPIAGRSGHGAVWAQDRMVIWGGALEGGVPSGDGASYDPVADAWTVLPAAPLEPRVAHRAVSSGDRMLVWGGSSGEGQSGTYFANGAVYTPASNSWTPMAPFPETREGGGRDTFSSVWAGEKMMVWGGYTRNAGCNPCNLEDGAIYDLRTNSWTLMSPGPLSGRGGHRAVWTGREMLVWGGFNATEQKDGATYNPESDTWTTLPLGPLLARQGHVMAWAGDAAVIWGGHGPHGEGASAQANHDDGALLRLVS